MNFKEYIMAAAISLAPAIVSAATVDITFTDYGSGKHTADIAGATAARDAFIGGMFVAGHETFDGFEACDGTNSATCAAGPVSTAVGTFTGIGPTGSGSSQVLPKDKVVVRADPPYAAERYEVEGSDGNWLDSNDMNGIKWEIPGSATLSRILKIAFFLTDVDDVGAIQFSISASNTGVLTNNVVGGPVGTRPNGELLLVTMLFSEAVDDVDIEMTSGTNDGFGLDGAVVAAVPLPAAGLLLLSALGGMAAVRRRRRKEV